MTAISLPEIYALQDENRKLKRENDDILKQLGRERIKVSEMEMQVGELREALEKIAYPIKWLQKEAKREGRSVSGDLAIRLANDANHLRGIAQKTLADLDAEGGGSND